MPGKDHGPGTGRRQGYSKCIKKGMSVIITETKCYVNNNTMFLLLLFSTIKYLFILLLRIVTLLK